jgi:tetratricopeptide (TPR) repeat protein
VKKFSFTAVSVMALLEIFFLAFSVPGFGELRDPLPLTPPYSLKRCLIRAEELFKANNYREAMIFYFESLDSASDAETQAKIHFRIGECLEAIRRYEFAGYHYKKAARGRLPDVLASRVLAKLKHLPQLAQHEEAMRLFKKAMASYQHKDLRSAIDDYLESLKMEPKLMAQDESGLIDDAIKYLTLLSESKDKEPDRLLKLATLLELRGESERAMETFKQLVIIYPQSPEAEEAREKIQFTDSKGKYLEFPPPADALGEVLPQETPLVFDTTLEFNDPAIISKDLGECAYTFKAFNELNEVPRSRFEQFLAVLGKGANQKEFLFRAEDGPGDRTISFDDGNVVYSVEFQEMNSTTAYVADMYGERARPVKLFSNIKIRLTVNRK